MTAAPQRCPFCDGTGTVVDEGWQHPGRGYRADYPRTLGDGLLECGRCDGTGEIDPDPYDVIRDAAEKAASDLESHHHPLNSQPRCRGCDRRWPCPSIKIARDLRTAIEETT